MRSRRQFSPWADRRTNRLFAAVALLFFVPPASWGESPQAPSAKGPMAKPKAAWTFLIYMAADCDLETVAMNNLRIIAQIGSTPDVNVLVLADRSARGGHQRNMQDELDSGYTAEGVANLPNWSGAKLLYVKKDHIEELANWGMTNTGDPATLTRFVDTGLERFPAERVGLILSDHGIGWQGSCVDEEYNDDLLDTNELSAALTTLTKRWGKFELIGFDACLMANIETISAAAPHADVIIASEELRPGTGWNYAPLLELVEKNPQSSGLELGAAVVRSFEVMLDPDPHLRPQWISLSVIKGDKVGEIVSSVDELAKTLQGQLARGGPDAWLRLSRARRGAVDFGSDLEPDRYDLNLLALLTASLFPRSDSARAATKLQKSIADAIPYHFHGRFRPGSHGLSVFFPSNVESLREVSWDIAYADLLFSQKTHWDELLADFVELSRNQPNQPLLREIHTSSTILGSDRSIEIECSLASDNVAQTALVIVSHLKQPSELVGYMQVNAESDRSLSETLGDHWFAVSNGVDDHPAPIFVWCDQHLSNLERGVDADEGAYGYGEVPVLIQRRQGSHWMPANLVFGIDFQNGRRGTGKLVEVYTKGLRGARELELFQGDKIRFLRMELDSQGRACSEAESAANPLIVDDPTQLSLSHYELPAGRYSVGFVATGYSGNSEITLVPISVVD